MEKTITFTMTESQAKKFEDLLDEFNNTVKRKEKIEVEREKNSNIMTDTRFLLTQAREELAKIKQFNSSRKSAIWER